MDNADIIYREVLLEQYLRRPWDANTPAGYLVWWCRSHGLEDYSPGEFFDTCPENLLHELLHDIYNHMSTPDYVPVDPTDWKVASLYAMDKLPTDIKMDIMSKAGLVRKVTKKWHGPSPRMQRLMNQWRRNQLNIVAKY